MTSFINPKLHSPSKFTSEELRLLMHQMESVHRPRAAKWLPKIYNILHIIAPHVVSTHSTARQQVRRCCGAEIIIATTRSSTQDRPFSIVILFTVVQVQRLLNEAKSTGMSDLKAQSHFVKYLRSTKNASRNLGTQSCALRLADQRQLHNLRVFIAARG
jgi:hypothetical protein